MEKLIVHVGYPKTATSTLQKNVLIPLHQQQRLNYLGEETASDMGDLHYDSKFVKNIILGEMKETTFPFFRWSDALAYFRRNGIDPAKRLTSNKGFLMPFVADGMINILSYESLLMPYRAVTTWTDFPRKLHDSLAAEKIDVQIVITLRNQAALMESFFFEKSLNYYLQSDFSSPRDLYFKDSSELSLRDCEQVEIFDFLGTLTAYEEMFGRDNIHIFFYEDIERNPESFFDKWAKILEIPASEVSTLFLGKPKSRVTAAEKNHFKLRVSVFDYLLKTRLISGPSQSVAFYNKSPKSRIRRVIGALKRMPFASRWMVDVKIPKFTAEEKTAIYNHFKASNAEAAEIYDLDLAKMKKYGYL